MLVLTRRKCESVVIGKDIIVTVSDIKNGQIKLGINANKKNKHYEIEIKRI